MDLLSRRKLISIGVAAGVANMLPLQVLSQSLGAAAAQSGVPAADSILIATPASHPSSTSIVDRLFPGLLSDAGFQQLLPVAFLVTNSSNKSMSAFSSHWTKTTPNGSIDWSIMHYFHRRSSSSNQLMHWGSKGNKTRYTGQIPVIKAGATRLITPFFNWGPVYYKKHGKQNWANLLSRRARREVSISDLTNPNTSFSMNIDAAITQDHMSLGPNDAFLVKVFTNTRNAEHDEAISVLRHMASGASTEQVKELLAQHASGLAFNIRPSSDLYYRVRQRQAKVLLRRLNHARSDQFQRTLIYLKSQSPTLIRSVASVS